MKRLKLNRWLISSIALFMLILVFQPEKRPPLEQIETKLANSDFFMEDIVIHKFNLSGKQINTLAATRMERSLVDDISILEKPVITFAKNGQGEWQLTSENGELINNSTIIKLQDSVKITEHLAFNQINTQISTTNLVINLQNNIASTDEPVMIESPYFQTKSKGMEIDFDHEAFLLKSNVTTKIYNTTNQ